MTRNQSSLHFLVDTECTKASISSIAAETSIGATHHPALYLVVSTSDTICWGTVTYDNLWSFHQGFNTHFQVMAFTMASIASSKLLFVQIVPTETYVMVDT